MNKIKKFIGICITAILISSGAFSAGATNYEGVQNNTNKTFIPILTYHTFDEQETAKFPGINTDPDDFKAQLNHFKELGYVSINNRELEEYLDGKRSLPDKVFMVTIDDGYASTYEAFEILKEVGYNATLFPITSHIQSGERFDLPMLSWEQLKEMNDSGVIEIGNHTHSLHVRHNGNKAGYEALITNVDLNGNTITNDNRKAMITKDLLEANRLLSENIGIEPPTSFSIPYGAYDDWSQQAAIDAGMEMVYTIDKGIVERGSDKITLKRIGANSSKPPVWYTDQFNEYIKTIDKNEPRVSLYQFGGKWTAVSFFENDAYGDATELYEVRHELWKDDTHVRTFSPAYRNFVNSNQMAIVTESGNGLSGQYDLKVIFVKKDGSKMVVWKDVTF